MSTTHSERTSQLKALLDWIDALEVPSLFASDVAAWRIEIETSLIRSIQNEYVEENKGRIIDLWNDVAVQREYPAATDAYYIQDLNRWFVVTPSDNFVGERTMDRTIGKGLDVEGIIKNIQNIRPRSELRHG